MYSGGPSQNSWLWLKSSAVAVFILEDVSHVLAILDD